MKIPALSFNLLKNNNKNLKNNKTNSSSELIEKQKLIMPTSAQILAFMGGYTLNLNEIFDKLKSEQYPPDIQEMVALESENENKTLYDVHFSKYKGVLNCLNLEELVEEYPEFENVKSAYKVFAKEDSFIGKFKNDELDLFPEYKDLTLQLIKLYWGQGFSLNDLSSYIEKNSLDKKGINLHYTMKKLNIPLMDHHYAQVLKLSNKEYNKKFTYEMSKRLQEANEIKRQKANGEVIPIPRGELSSEHKQRISDGLKKHYAQHPEKIYEMSEVQKRFYEEHPEKKKEFSEVMLYTWNDTPEGKSVHKYIKKFMKKNNAEITQEELALKQDMDKRKQNLLKEFWNSNFWAKEKLSIAMKKAWEAQKGKNKDLEEIKNMKTVPGVKMVMTLMPEQAIKKIEKWAKMRNIDIENLVFSKSIVTKQNVSETVNLENRYIKRSQAILNRYFEENPKESNIITTCLHSALLDLETSLKNDNGKLPESLKNNPPYIKLMQFAYNAACYTADIPTMEALTMEQLGKEIDVKSIYSVYNDLAYQAINLGCYDFGQYMEERINDCYEIYSKMPIFK